MKLSLFTFPWLSMTCIGLAYALLGWHLSFLSMFWLVEFWLATVITLFLLLWRGGLISRWVRLGPTVLVSIFFISLTVMLAITYAEPFGLALVLLLSIFWGRIELQARGLHQRLVLACLFLMSSGGLTLGWIVGRDPRVVEMLRQSVQQSPWLLG
jgi:hypothetical protein